MPFSELTGAELKERFPGVYQTLDDDTKVLVEETKGGVAGVAGVIDMQKLLTCLHHYLEDQAVHIRYGSEVAGIDEIPETDTYPAKAIIQLKDSNTRQLFDHVVIAPGQWISTMPGTEEAGIQSRLVRNVVVSLDLEKLGIQTKGIPFSKGQSVDKGGSYYGFDADPDSHRLKFMPQELVTDHYGKAGEIQRDVTEDEKEIAVQATAKQFGLDEQKVRDHIDVSTCVYTCPKKGEGMLVDTIGKHNVATVVALPSSGAARIAGGIGNIAAHLALGKEEPCKGAYEHFALHTHCERIENRKFDRNIDPELVACMGCQHHDKCNHKKAGGRG